MVLKKSFRVLRKYKPRSVLLESREIDDEALLFESNTIATLSPAEVDVIRREYGDAVAAYGCLGVLQINQGTETFHYLLLLTDCQSVGKVRDVEVFRITQTTFAPLSSRANLELVQDVGKLLASGRFYFAYPSYGAQFDLLACAQKQGKEQRHFFWNRALYAYMQRFGVECKKWLVRTMCGSVEIQTVYAGDKQAKACLFSRLNCERAGTRLQTRGTDDSGQVGNFVETEQAIYVDNNVASFVQIRGVVPLFWEQPGIQTGGGMIRIKFSRGYMCSRPAFERHFEWCLLHYGPTLCVNLLGTRNQEQMLSTAFQEHFQQLSSAYCAEMVCFDYHQICKGNSSQSKLESVLLPMVNEFLTGHSFYVKSDGQILRNQTGTIRSNCLDCLDRSNAVQTFLSSVVLLQLMTVLGLQTKPSLVSRFQQLFSLAWTRNGHNISWLYAGTRAMEGKGLKLKDGARSVQRTILNNFLDKAKNEAIEMLLFCSAQSGDLGQKAIALLEKRDVLAPLNFKQALLDRWSEYTTPEKLRVCIGTWNVNGGKHIRSIALRNQSLHDWLLDAPFISGIVKEHPEEFAEPPDIFAIGFQELVGLTASNIVSASSANRKEWATELQKVLSRDTPYELLTAEQMVGICLYIFIRPKLIPFIRDVSVNTVKTGMSGKTGNKGGVVIRFLLHSTSVCFVCSHLAAHQAKVQERNQDFVDICRRVQFPHGQTLESHDYVFWCGDFNYRIDLPTHIAKDHIAAGRWDNLVKQDQLIKQKKLKKAFNGFIEGGLNFAPTYKYDQFSDDYDTSEKCRTPAWCDRILWRRKPFVADRSMTSHMSKVSMSSIASSENLLVDGEEREDSPPAVAWDFGLHPSDAGKVCKREMEGGGGGGLVNTGYPWHPGRLLFYNRAELKQSDHRPVVALIEVDTYRVDEAKRIAVREEVGLLLGPSDPTVVVRELEGENVDMTALVDSVKRFGEVVLVRATEENILVTFKESQSAMAATALNGQTVAGVKLEVSLLTPWPALEEEGGQGAVGGDRPANKGGQVTESPPGVSGVAEGSLVREKPVQGARVQGLGVQGARVQGLGVHGAGVKVLTLERLSLLRETADDGCGLEQGSEVNDELMEFSYTEQTEYSEADLEDVAVDVESGQGDGMEPEHYEMEPGHEDGMEPGHEDGMEPGHEDEQEPEEPEMVVSSSSSEEDEREQLTSQGGHLDSGEEEERESPVTIRVHSASPDPAPEGKRDAEEPQKVASCEGSHTPPPPPRPVAPPRPSAASRSRSPSTSPTPSPTPQRPQRRERAVTLQETYQARDKPVVPARPSRPPAPQRPLQPKVPPTRPQPPKRSNSPSVVPPTNKPAASSSNQRAPPVRPARPPNRPPPPPTN